MAGDLSLAGSLTDLLRLMLAEDPDHRPLPGQLIELVNARGRRLAARPARRSQTALMLNDVTVFDSRTLAYALLLDEKKAIQFLRNGLITQWLRRGLGDASLAAQIEDLVRSRLAETKPGPWSDPLLVMHTITALNPRMPLCWRGVAMWPDALHSMVAEGIALSPEILAVAEELITADIFSVWSEARLRRSGRSDSPEQLLQQQLLQAGARAGMLRLFYEMNPLLPCRTSGMAARWIATLPALMHYFESAAEKAADSLLDIHTSAFIAARADRKLELQVAALVNMKDADSFRMGELALLRDMQSRYHPSPMPALAKWVVTRLQPNLERWHNRPRRAALQQRLDTLAAQGQLSRLLELAEDRSALVQDSAGSALATAEIARIDAEMATIDHGEKGRLVDAERFGRAITGGIGLSVLILTLMSVLLR